jgi:hypothetical protein
MPEKFNIYCDESCHLEHDRRKVMVLGAVWCAAGKVREAAVRLRETKTRHGLKAYQEVKWTKVSPSLLPFYLDYLDYFFDDSDLHVRGLFVPDKAVLDHSRFKQTHDDWYYKMYFDLLKVVLSPDAHYRIFLDYKDTHGAAKARKLREVLCNNMYDFSRKIVEPTQLVRSHEVELLQMADVLSGAVAYVNEGLASSPTKLELVERIRHRTGYTLTKSTLLREAKFNLLRWEAKEGE